MALVANTEDESTKPYDGPREYNELLKEIRENSRSCELILCIFLAALHSYRSDRCLRPFPPLYYNDQGKDFTTLRNICDTIPPFRAILAEPKKCPEDVYKFLIWLFFERKIPILNLVNFDRLPIHSTSQNISKPHFVFQVSYAEKIQTNWEKRKGGRDTFFAYHGSAVDNFYSILSVGLQQNFSADKEVLFGQGIYLSTDLALSAHYSHFGHTWKNSSIGKKHSIIAICEIINDIEKVKCKDSDNESRSQNKGTYGTVPEKYFVVTDSDMVRVKYLLVYREKSVSSVKSYITHYFFIVLICMYLYLSLMGTLNYAFYLKIVKKMSHMIDFK